VSFNRYLLPIAEELNHARRSKPVRGGRTRDVSDVSPQVKKGKFGLRASSKSQERHTLGKEKVLTVDRALRMAMEHLSSDPRENAIAGDYIGQKTRNLEEVGYEVKDPAPPLNDDQAGKKQGIELGSLDGVGVVWSFVKSTP